MKGINVDRLIPLLPTLELPCFIYDPGVVTANVQELRTAFPDYLYPVKCNAIPALIRAALSAGAELDLCSAGDLDLAKELDALTPRSSYTGAGLTPELLQCVAAAGCRVNLDSVGEVALWASVAPGRAYGVRLQTGYNVKFGLSPAELHQARALAGTIAGVHVHDSHRGRTPDEASAALAAALRPLDENVVRELEYVSLGGGWPHGYEGEASWEVSEVAAAMAEQPIRGLREKGFRGEVLVEPGEFIVASAGAWLARVATVKSDRERAGQRLVILDTPTPMPCADFAYPITLLHRNGMSTPTTIYGSTNSGRDRIREGVHLPDPSPGDIVVVHDAGAYIQALISGFNERRRPSTYVLPW